MNFDYYNLRTVLDSVVIICHYNIVVKEFQDYTIRTKNCKVHSSLLGLELAGVNSSSTCIWKQRVLKVNGWKHQK